MNFNLYRIIIPVPDIDKAEAFYKEVLDQPGVRVSNGRHYFNLNGTILALYDPIADGDNPGTWNFHENQYIYIAVDDLAQIHSKMVKLKCENLGEIEEMPWGETLFYTNDPFGTPLCFVDASTIFTGD